MLLGAFMKLARHESGNVLMMTALAMPLMIGGAGLATDTVQWSLWKRQIQRQADSAALAGAFSRAQGASVNGAVTADLARNSQVPLSTPAVVENAPTVGSYAGNVRAVRVVLQTRRVLPFSSILGVSTPTIQAEATAAAVQEGEYCVVSLETGSVAGITFQGNATANLGCGMITNSRAANAVDAGGSSAVTANPVAAVGGLQASGAYASGTSLTPYSIPQEDPFASIPNPTLPASCSNKLIVGPHDTRSLTGGGCYRGMDIKGRLELGAGTYYIDGSSFSVGAQGVIVGTNVTIVLTSSTAATNPGSIATVNINGGATLQMSSPTSGTYKGILFYQDRRAPDSGSNLVNGNASSSLEGALYFPSQQVDFSGTAGMQTNCLQVVGRRVALTGNSSISNTCPPGGGGGGIPATRVRLVA